MNSALGRIIHVLATIGASGSFATQRTAEAKDLRLEIQGAGRIRFPISPATARKLCAVASQAHHGYKDQTRLDQRVRDTWEIHKSQILIDELLWDRTLTHQLDQIRGDLGLPDGCRVKAQLYNLLIYAPGQFFVPHQDSEKLDDMTGTLVVNLPSQFTGGEMVIKHHEHQKVVGGSGKSLTFIAFYADCHHEVRPIRQGYRVVLTYNLIIKGDIPPATTNAAQLEELSARVRDFFDTPSPPRWASDFKQGPPDRLVYLLDHEYTQSGLAWNRLKNGDAARATALCEVARQLDCEIYLALADVHETWACEEEFDDYSPRGRRWHREYENEEEEDNLVGPSSGTPKLTDLIDRHVELRHWIGLEAKPKAIASKVIVSGVNADELCYTKPSSDLNPFESEHEGYTGNAGNTVEHWYHRAAVTLWPRARTFVIRAKESPRWAISEIEKSLKAGTTAEAVALARCLLPFWSQIAGRDTGNSLLSGALKVVASLDNPGVAAALLQPFTLSKLLSKSASPFATLLDRYGPEWCRTLLHQWTTDKLNYELPATKMAWVGSALPALCRSLCARASLDGQALAQWILMGQWNSVRDYLQLILKSTSTTEIPKQLTPLSKAVLAMFDSAQIANCSDLHRQISDYLTAADADLLLHLRLGLLRAAHDRHRPDALRESGLKPIQAHCVNDLTTRLNALPRANDDWSIKMSIRCTCNLCATLRRYLRAPEIIRLEWPLAKAGRAHIHRIVDSHDLPLRHVTRRTGSPFTLVLEKTAALFDRDVVERRFWQTELRWLSETAESF